jgi:hypothetical protein
MMEVFRGLPLCAEYMQAAKVNKNNHITNNPWVRPYQRTYGYTYYLREKTHREG